MNYRAAVITHAAHDYQPMLDALREFIMPLPGAVTVHRDNAPQLGFCKATEKLWQECADAEEDYVLWLEMDFRFARPVDLRELASVLDANPRLAQMALMRDAYSDEEKAAGGLYEYRTRFGDYQTRRHYVYEDDLVARSRHRTQYPWLSQSFFTTNPSLMRRDFMADHLFIADEPHCEGKFSIGLREQGYEFGTWGDGDVWVNHIGHRDGSGHGY